MEEWKEYKLGEIASVQTGPFGSQLHNKDYVKYGIPIVTVEHLGSRKFTTQNLPHVSSSDAERLKKYRLVKGDIVFSRVGSVDRCSFVSDEEDGWLFSGRCLRVRLKSIFNSLFIYYQFEQSIFKDHIRSIAVGATMPSINTKILSDVIVKIPSLPTQQKIASILSSLDDKIEVNRRINENLEQQAQALFKSWFIDFEPFQEGEFEDSEMGRIPKGWRVGTLNEIGNIVGGGTPSKSKSEYYCKKGIAWITPKDLSLTHAKFTSHGELYITELGYKNSSTKILPKDSVLFSSRAPIGYITIALNEICTNQGFKSVVPKKAGTAFIYCFLKANTEKIEHQATGSTFKEASGALMKSQKVLIPNDDTFERFEKLLKPLFNQQALCESENQSLATLRDTLLPKLMSGEIEV